MSKANVVRIEKFEIKKSDMDKVKRVLKIKDNVEAIKKALDITTGKIELENLFEKYKGTTIKKLYA
jgi:hypothetical protein